MRHAEFRFTAGRFLLLLVVATASSLACPRKERSTGDQQAVRKSKRRRSSSANLSEMAESRSITDSKLSKRATSGLGWLLPTSGRARASLLECFRRSSDPRGRIYAVDISEKFVRHVEASAKANGSDEHHGGDLPAGFCESSTGLNRSGVHLRHVSPLRVSPEDDAVDSSCVASRWSGRANRFPPHSGKNLRLGDESRSCGAGRFHREIVESGFRQVQERQDLLKESYFVRFEKMEKSREPERNLDRTVRGGEGNRRRVRNATGSLLSDWREVPELSGGSRRRFRVPGGTACVCCRDQDDLRDGGNWPSIWRWPGRQSRSIPAFTKTKTPRSSRWSGNSELRRSAADLLLVERAKEWLLED